MANVIVVVVLAIALGLIVRGMLRGSIRACDGKCGGDCQCCGHSCSSSNIALTKEQEQRLRELRRKCATARRSASSE